jgi:hypothetical protein
MKRFLLLTLLALSVLGIGLYFVDANLRARALTDADRALAAQARLFANSVDRLLQWRMSEAFTFAALPSLRGFAASDEAAQRRQRAADFEQMLAFDGVTTLNYSKGITRARFVFTPTLDNATYVIVDNLWRGWAAERMPPLKNYLRQIESWQRVMQQGEFDVYRNPKR